MIVSLGVFWPRAPRWSLFDDPKGHHATYCAERLQNRLGSNSRYLAPGDSQKTFSLRITFPLIVGIINYGDSWTEQGTATVSLKQCLI